MLEGKQGEQGPKGEAGRGIIDTVYNTENGRWVTNYTDGTTSSTAGYDPTDSSIWSFFKDNFERYKMGGDPEIWDDIPESWEIQSAYKSSGKYFIMDEATFDGTEQFLGLATFGSTSRASIFINHEIQGESILEFDFMSKSDKNGTKTNMLDVIVLGTRDFRARVNYSGQTYIYTDGNTVPGVPSSAKIKGKDGNNIVIEKGVWYKLKIHTMIGKIILKVWKRGEPEPDNSSKSGVTILENEYFTPEYLMQNRRINFVVGPMNADPTNPNVGWFYWIDNVRVYRDLALNVPKERLWTVTVPVDGWYTEGVTDSGEIFYTNRINVDGILESDRVDADIILGMTNADIVTNNKNAKEAWALVDIVDVNDGYIMLIAPDAKPQTEFTLQLKALKAVR